jgi:hypothetical protein
MNPKLSLVAAGVMAIVFTARTQEYNSADASTVEHSTNAAGDKITTYTSFKTTHYHGQTKRDEYVSVDTDYAPVCSKLDWTWSKRAPTTVSSYRGGDWTGVADVDADSNREAQPFAQQVQQPTVPVNAVSIPITADYKPIDSGVPATSMAVKITSNRWTSDKTLIATGTLTNTSAAPVKITKVIASGFDVHQNLVAVTDGLPGDGSYTIGNAEIAPGATDLFKVALNDEKKIIRFVTAKPYIVQP